VACNQIAGYKLTRSVQNKTRPWLGDELARRDMNGSGPVGFTDWLIDGCADVFADSGARYCMQHGKGF